MEFLVVIGVIIVVVALIFSANNRREKDLEAARAAYMRALSELRNNPRSAELRQQTLALGRRYSQLARSSKAVAVFDEAMLMDDINAASAAAAVLATSPAEQRLRALSDLKTKGLIDDAEYAKRRNEILGSI